MGPRRQAGSIQSTDRNGVRLKGKSAANAQPNPCSTNDFKLP
jgi:hypothetical protein